MHQTTEHPTIRVPSHGEDSVGLLHTRGRWHPRGSPVILVDANVLLYAEDQQSPHHVMAREWWDAQLSGASPVCLCWTVLGAFIRIGTNPRVFDCPLSLDQALSRVQSWIDQPCTRIVHPT